jgi:Animal haem peroxidase
MISSFFYRLIALFYSVLNRLVAWHRLPAALAALNLGPYRDALRAKNLHSTSPDVIPENPATKMTPKPNAEYLYRRSSDGIYNDLTDPKFGPAMGAAHTRFGRNMPRDRVYPEAEPRLLDPSPRIVSCRLLAGRDDKHPFKPAETLNLLAASWIQFMTHDWFHHTTGRPGNEFQVSLDRERNDTWPDGDPMKIRRTPADPTRVPGANDGPPTYLNDGSHWWDGSQVYGNNEQETAALRAKAKHPGELLLVHDLLPIDPATQQQQAGLVDNWWLGLSLMHTLFVREHNAIVSRLRVEYPEWAQGNGDRLFHTARLINVALMAKIHTVEWTPAILGHPAIQIALNANWWGVAGEKIKRLIGRISDDEVISGIPGAATDHHGCPYALTEEFVSVYRLHGLMPDSIRLHRVKDGSFVREWNVVDLLNEKVLNALDGGLTMDDVCYSFGIANPGAVVLHNYPKFLRELKRPQADAPGGYLLLDLAAVDVLRDRERGVPRYNDFRKLLRLPRRRTFDEITSNKEWARELEDVYKDVDRVDLMVGMYAEDFPKGFGFSDTAFRIFILMASRRLESDRFFTTDYTAKVYTQTGLDWIDANNMSSLLLRHFPGVSPALRQVKNAFAPWPRIDEMLRT